MTQKKTPILTEAEFRIMNTLWTLRSGTVHDILNALPKNEKPAYTTVLTIMQILTRKGAVRHERQDRRYHYYPLIAQQEARRNAARDFADRFFGGSKTLLMHSLFEEDELDEETIERLSRRIEQIEEEE